MIMRGLSLLCLTLFFASVHPGFAACSDSLHGGTQVISGVRIIGNKVTRKHIIMREVTLAEGDSLCALELEQRIAKVRQNLLNTSLFNFVTIMKVPEGKDRVTLLIDVEERWYTWPGPIFELADRNFNTWIRTGDAGRINYGFFLYRDNFRGRKERVTFLFKTGYTRQFGLAYNIPYLDKKQKVGMNFSISWSANHEVNYASKDNQQLFFHDPDQYVRREFSSKAGVSYRPGIYNTFSTEVKYYNGRLSDTIPSLENDYYADDGAAMQYLTLSLYFRHDRRDNKAYPLKGHFLDMEVGKNGFGVLDGETVDQVYTFLSARKYWKLSDRWFPAMMVKGKFSDGSNVPYFLTRGLGYRDNIRGYEYYVMDGSAFGLAKTSMKFCLVKPKVKQIKFLPWQKFNKFHYALYLEAFGEGGYVYDEISAAANALNNSLQFGYGAGIHYVTYYDITFRLEYSRNSLNEGGVFLNFFAPF